MNDKIISDIHNVMKKHFIGSEKVTKMAEDFSQDELELFIEEYEKKFKECN